MYLLCSTNSVFANKKGLNRELNPGHVHLHHPKWRVLPKHVSYYWTIEPFLPCHYIGII